MDYPRRKPTRMRNYDYGRTGAYFITICTNNRDLLFDDLVGADPVSARAADDAALTQADIESTPTSIATRLVDEIFKQTIRQFPGVACPKYVIMPNHIHAIIVIKRADTGSAPTATIPEIIQTFKRISTVEYIKLVNQGLAPPFYKQVWQRSYYDHIIRNEQEFKQICGYIDDNQRKWRENPGEV